MVLSSRAARTGGICGLVAAVAVLPALLAGVPDAAATSGGGTPYRAATWVSVYGNGLPIMLLTAFFVPFLTVLVSYIRSITDEHDVLPGVAATSGGVYVALACAASAAEVAYAAGVAEPANPSTDLSVLRVMLELAGWLYNFALVGFALLVGAVSLAVFRSRALPRWVVGAGGVTILAVLLRQVLPLGAPIMLVAWLLLVSMVLMRNSSIPRGVQRLGSTRGSLDGLNAR